MSTNLENSAVATGLEKVSFHSDPKKGNAKEFSNYWTIALISHASKVMLKVLQAMLQHYVNWELPDVVLTGFRKGRGTGDQIVNIHWIIENGNSKKYIHFWFIDYTKACKCVDHISSVQFSHSVMSNSLQPREAQLDRPPCPSPTPGFHP